MIQGYLDGLTYMQAHPEESAKIIGEVLGVSAEEAVEQMAGAYNIPLRRWARASLGRRHPFLPWQRRDHRQAAQGQQADPDRPGFQPDLRRPIHRSARPVSDAGRAVARLCWRKP